MEYIEGLLQKKALWIKKKIAEVGARPESTLKKFVSGESFLYLGDFYKLRISREASEALAFGKEFVVSADRRLDARALLCEWYKSKGVAKIPARVELYARRIGVNVGPTTISPPLRIGPKRRCACTMK